MLCPRCANEKTEVVGTVKGLVNERFRNCPRCGYKWQTVEIVKTNDYASWYVRQTLLDFDEEKSKK